MAIAHPLLIDALRTTADRLAGGAAYQWSHFGRCNCGHLAQTVTGLSAAEIHRRARRELLEWSEIPEDYCAATGVRVEFAIDALFEIGLSRDDIRHLEDLDDPRVLAGLPGGFRWLERNRREDAIAYLRAWAALLESEHPAPAAVAHPAAAG